MVGTLENHRRVVRDDLVLLGPGAEEGVAERNSGEGLEPRASLSGRGERPLHLVDEDERLLRPGAVVRPGTVGRRRLAEKVVPVLEHHLSIIGDDLVLPRPLAEEGVFRGRCSRKPSGPDPW